MNFESTRAVEERSNTEVEVYLTSSRQEKLFLDKAAPKVVSIDNLLKSTFAILQIIVIGLQGWMLTKILEHGDRVTKLEMRQESGSERTHEVMSNLREILQKQSKLLEDSSVMKSDLERMKGDLKSLQERPK